MAVIGRVGFLAYLMCSMVALGTGCGQSDGRVAITGKVTLAGQPLDRGNIMFVPASGQGSQTGALITAGAYEIQDTQGLQPGKYKVAISSADGETPVAADTLPGPSGNFASKDRIPEEFNTNSKLEVEVTKDGPNTFDFAIP